MTDYGMVSIITPSYNCAKFIGECIESIQAQTYKNWEMLITDDCSTDTSREIIQHYTNKDPRIKLYTLDTNSGAGVARNRSISEAKGRYMAFCDSDDRWYPEKLEKQLRFMNEGGYEFSHTSYLTCNEEGETTGIIVCKKKETLKSMLSDDKMGFLTVMYDTKKIGKPLMPVLRKRQDWAYKLKILQKCHEAHGMKEPLAIYRHSSDSISKNKKSLVKYNIAVYTDILKWNKIHAYSFFFFIFMPKYLLKKSIQRYINR